MAIRAKIVLPDNLESSFLRSEFLMRGAAYSTELQSDVPADLSPDAAGLFNKQSIVLGFALEDTDTRQAVPLERVVSLKISNDPRMAPESTVEIQAWPAAAFDAAKLYRYVLNPLYFVDPTDNPQTLVAGDGAETPDDPALAGLFEVDNWPLSCNGGLATVYLKAVVKSTLSDEEVSYPEGYGVYDGILWEPERPSTPGTPMADGARGGMTGRQTLWRFGASEEGASGLYGEGVARYLGDVVETRMTPLCAGSGPALGLGNQPLGMTQGSYDGSYYVDNTFQPAGYAANGPYVAGEPIAGTGHDRLVMAAAGIELVPSAPDFGAQAAVSFAPPVAGAGASMRIMLYDDSQTDPFHSPQCYVAEINLLDGRGETTVFHTDAGAAVPPRDAHQTLASAATARCRAAGGGLLEAYVSQRPGEDHAMLVAYFTPKGSQEAVTIRQCPAPPLSGGASWRAAVSFLDDNQGAVSLDGLSMASGRFLLGADLGDCRLDSASASSLASFLCDTQDAWTEAFARSEAVVRVFDGSLEPRGGMTASVGPNGVSLHTAAPPAPARDYVEVAVSRPTLSDRALVRWSGVHLRGDLYVALSPSPRPDAQDEPMGLACDPDFAGGEDSSTPCLLVGFSALRKAVYVAHRKGDGSLVVRDWIPYASEDAIGGSDPQDFPDDASDTTWSLVASNFDPKGEAEGTWLSLYRNEDVVGTTRLEDRLPTSDSGTGFYVSLGARSYRVDDVRTSDAAVANVGVLIKSLLVRGLPPIERDDAGDVDGQRHFRKANGAPSHLKPLLGQALLSGITDLGEPLFSAPAETPWTRADGSVVRVLDVDHVVTCDVPSSGAAGTLDGAPLVVDGLSVRTGQRVLACGQAAAAQNGVYVVGSVGTGGNGVWARDPLLSTSAQVAANKYVRVAEPIVVDVVLDSALGAPAAGTSDLVGCPLVVDDVTLAAGDLVLVADSGAQSGVWGVVWQGTGSNGVWRRPERYATTDSLKAGTTARASRGTAHGGSVWTVDAAPGTLGSDPFQFVTVADGGQRLDGTLWHVEALPAGFQLDATPLAWRCTTVAQRVTPLDFGAFFVSLNAGLLEVQARPTKPLANPPARLRAKLAAADPYELGPEGVGLTPWLGARELGSGALTKGEPLAAATSLAQFELSDYGVSLSQGQPCWMLVQVPPGFELLSGYAKAQGLSTHPARGRRSGVATASSAWHKLFASAAVRHDNVFDGAAIQMRAVAESHARVASLASALGAALSVDVAPPAFGATGKPRVTMPRLPTVRTATLWIEASDDASGVAAFRVGKENGQGSAAFGEWQPFADFASFQPLLPCRVAYEASSASDLSGLKGVGGVQLAAGDRVLVYAASPESFVGVYDAAAGAWSRAADLASSEQIAQQLRALTLEGDQAGKEWYVALPAPASAPPYYALGATPLNWQRDLPQRTVAEYTVYLQGFWPQDGWGADDALMRSQNAGLDGARRIWVQTIDALGNLSEADPLTVPAQGIALVDTVPPSGSATFVGPDGQPSGLLASPQALLRVDAADRVSEVKDVRVRDLGTGAQGAWGPWTSASQFKRVDVSQPFGDPSDGLRRLEVQARDYGNNVVPSAPRWDLLDADGAGRTIVCMAPWRSDDDDFYYAGGVKHVEFVGCGLQDAMIALYGTNLSFYAVSNEAGSTGRRVPLTRNDVVAVRANGAALVRTEGASTASGTFFVDAERGVVVLSQPPAVGTTLECDVARDTAVLARGNGRWVEEVADLGRLGERIVLSLAATDQGLFLGTDSGAVYAYDGFSVEGPLFQAEDGGSPLPITAFCAHRFAHESASRLYACTAGVPRLYRTELGLTAGAWEPCGVGIEDLSLPSGDATSLCCAFDKLFVGTSTGRVVRYWRSQDAAGRESESALSSVLTSDGLRGSEAAAMPVTSLLASGSSVYAGVGNKPEVWRLAIKKSQSPRSGAEWSSARFDRLFSMDPAPWQYYTSSARGDDGVDVSIVDGNTISRASGHNLTWFAVSDESSQGGMRDYVALRGQDGKETNLSCGPGSDWEQVAGEQTSYGIEVCPMRISGAGRQGLRVADGRYEYTVSWDDARVYLSNGTDPELSARIDGGRDGVAAMSLRSDYGGGEYPRRGVRRVWNFALTDAASPYTAEDRGPREPGSGEGAFSAMGWTAGPHVVPAVGGAAGVGVVLTSADATENTTSWTAETTILRVTAALNGDPVILLGDAAPAVPVGGGARAMVRARVVASDSIDLSGASLRLGWSSNADDPTPPENWTEAPLRREGEFALYEFRPSWDGSAAGLALGISNVGEARGSSAARSLILDLDYVAIVADEPNSNFTDNGTPVRVGVSGRDVTVWAGFTDAPQLTAKGLLALPTERVELRLGKVDVAEAGSEWAYSGVAFAAGFPEPPISVTARFALAWRFPSAGGVTHLLHHRGTMHALTMAEGGMRMADDPDDRAAKAWVYDAPSEAFSAVGPTLPRLDGGQGVVRFLAACDFRGALVASGQKGQLAYAP